MSLRCYLPSVLVLLLHVAAPGWAGAQTGAIRGVVVDARTGQRLSYSLVGVIPGTGDQFTSDSGTFSLIGLPAGAVRLRVRHLGFTPRVTTVQVVPGQIVQVRLDLVPFVLTLKTMRVVAQRTCSSPGAPDPLVDSTMAAVFAQLEQNADRYALLMREYPFRSTYEVTEATMRRGGVSATIVGPTEVESGRSWSYAPGHVVSDRGRVGAWVNVPTLDVFADRRFVASHCFWYAGMEPFDGDTLLRVDFRVADRIHDPDLDGSMYLDPVTYLIQASRLRLSALPRSLDHGDSAIIITRFDELLPGVPFVSDILSLLYMKPARRGSGDGEFLATEEERRRTEVHFLDRAPPQWNTAAVAALVAPLDVRPVQAPRMLGVFDAISGMPLDQVTVTDSITHHTGTTGQDGTLRLDFLSQAGGVLTLQRAGYATVRERIPGTPGDTTAITIVMTRLPH